MTSPRGVMPVTMSVARNWPARRFGDEPPARPKRLPRPTQARVCGRDRRDRGRVRRRRNASEGRPGVRQQMARTHTEVGTVSHDCPQARVRSPPSRLGECGARLRAATADPRRGAMSARVCGRVPGRATMDAQIEAGCRIRRGDGGGTRRNTRRGRPRAPADMTSFLPVRRRRRPCAEERPLPHQDIRRLPASHTGSLLFACVRVLFCSLGIAPVGRGTSSRPRDSRGPTHMVTVIRVRPRATKDFLMRQKFA